MAEYTVRELTIDDSALLSSLYATLDNMRAVGTLSEAQGNEILARMIVQDSHLFVAIDKEAGIIGTTTLLDEQKFIREGSLAAHIEDVSVRKGFEGKGIAKAVLNAALTYAKDRGCYKILLDCEEKLTGLYEKFDFKVVDKHMRLNP